MLARESKLMRTNHSLRRTNLHRTRKYWSFIHYWAEMGGEAVSAVETAEIEDDAAKIRRLEAALFVAREGISSRKLAKLAGLADATEARTLIRRLNERYVAHQRSYRIEEIAGGYALMTSTQFATWLRRLGHVPGDRRLSQTAMETLAVVAYRQPVQRAEVEAIRGVGCSEVLRQLMDLELVRITGRSEDLGRPYLYGTTKRFLQMFGLRSVDRLPRMSWVNEPVNYSSSSLDSSTRDSEAEDSAMIHSTVADKEQMEATMELAASALLDEGVTIPRQPTDVPAERQSMDDDEYFEDEDDDDEYDDDDYDDDDEDDDDGDDGDWDDEDSDEEDDDDDLEEENEWEEVDDDDDGWVDDEDDEEDDDEEEDMWGDDDMEEEDDWD